MEPLSKKKSNVAMTVANVPAAILKTCMDHAYTDTTAVKTAQ